MQKDEMMKKIKVFFSKCATMTCFMLVALVSVCWSQNPVELKNGFWRATIQRSDGQQIVFNFQSKDSAGKKIIYVINGKEHLLIDSMVTLGDSVFIQMPFFESGFSAKITADGNLQGVWIKKNGAVVLVLPFNAVYNHKERFAVSASPVTDITGSWSADFIGKNNKISALVGEFKQDGAYLSGTFRDPTGDYRFLQGVVDGDSLKLSAFDGSNAFLFTAKIDNKNKISGGRLYSGALRTEEWSAVRNDKATLPDVFSETKLRPGAGKLNFSFPEMSDGSKVSINDKRFKNKVVVISILGSWCPNCMDETKFLSDYYNKNHQKDIEFIGLAYERDTDFKTCQRLLQPFKKRFNVQYPILITGVALSDSLLTEKTLPQLEKIHAFPTTIFVDKKGNIRKIHSGFDGPATGKYYIQFKKEFNEIINQLLGEE